MLAIAFNGAASATSPPGAELPAASALDVFPLPATCGGTTPVPTDAWIVVGAPTVARASFLAAALRESALVSSSGRSPLRAEVLCEGRRTWLGLRPETALPAGEEVRLDVPGFRDTLRELGCRKDLWVQEAGKPALIPGPADDPSWIVGAAPTAEREWWTRAPRLKPISETTFGTPLLALSVPPLPDALHSWLRVELRAEGEVIRTIQGTGAGAMTFLRTDTCGGVVTRGRNYEVSVSVLDDAGRAHEAPGGPLRLRLDPPPTNWTDAHAAPPAPMPSPAQPAPPATASGCASGGVAPGWSLFLAAAVALRRARPNPSPPDQEKSGDSSAVC
jgi:hypothetical protein